MLHNTQPKRALVVQSWSAVIIKYIGDILLSSESCFVFCGHKFARSIVVNQHEPCLTGHQH